MARPTCRSSPQTSGDWERLLAAFREPRKDTIVIAAIALSIRHPFRKSRRSTRPGLVMGPANDGGYNPRYPTSKRTRPCLETSLDTEEVAAITRQAELGLNMAELLPKKTSMI